MARESSANADPSNHTQKHVASDNDNLNSTKNHLKVSTSGSSSKRPITSPLSLEHPSPKKNKAPSPAPEDTINKSHDEAAPAGDEKNEDDEDAQVNPTSIIDKSKWQGYCEIESEPAYFNTILREIGVEDVTVREVPMLDADTISFLPSPIFGLIMLFRARQFDTEKQSEGCPANVWFANQMPAQNSCATLAMVHTILNIAPDADVDIGEYMRSFKDFTKDFTPYQRGETFASWDRLKKVHNSFAKPMDIMENDRYVSFKARRAASKASKAKKAAEANMAANNTDTKKNKKKANADDRRASDASVSSTESIEDSAHHYIAFIPVDGKVYKLDGLDHQPTLIGEYDTSAPETWIYAISDRVMALMAAAEDDDYGLFSLSQSPMVKIKQDFIEAHNSMEAVEERLSEITTDWKDLLGPNDTPPTPSWFGGISEKQFAAHPAPQTLLDDLVKEDDVVGLLGKRSAFVNRQQDGALAYSDEEMLIAEEAKKARERRSDYGPVIKRWMEMLAANGHLANVLNQYSTK